MPQQVYKLELKRAKECKHSVVFEPKTPSTPDKPSFATGVYITRDCIPNGAQSCTLTLEWTPAQP